MTESHRLQFKSLTVGDLSAKTASLSRIHGPYGLPFDIAGPRIVFSRNDAKAAQSSIQSMAINGGIPTPLDIAAGNQDDTPSVSASNGHVVFARGDNAGKLFVMDSSGSNKAQLTNPPSGKWDVQPVWSNKSKYIAFVRSWQLWLMNANGTNARPVFNYGTSVSALDHAPSWSPNDDHLAFWRDRGNVSTIATVAIDPTAAVPAGGNVVSEISNPGHDPDKFDAWPSWSKASNRIAFMRNHEIWTMDSDGTSQKNVSNPNHAIGEEDVTPCWSPDGTFIAFSRTKWVAYNIYSIFKDGTSLQQLTFEDYVCDFYPSWQAYTLP